jgi:uncharacterized peroxidase-related enzyme
MHVICEAGADLSSGCGEQSPSSHYLDLIRTSQSTGRETWNIWYLFAFRPEMTAHLARFTQEVMREPSPLSPGLRELIAAYTSYINKCGFCTKAHVAVAADLLGSEELVWTALRNLDASCLKEEEKALLRFAGRVTSDLPSITEADVKSLRALGWNDESIYYTITVCALFNFYNRWITASGVHAVSDEGHRLHGKVLAQKGYDPQIERTALGQHWEVQPVQPMSAEPVPRSLGINIAAFQPGIQ